MVKATLSALTELRRPEDVAQERGVDMALLRG
jgi:ribosomal protein S5